MQRKENVIVSVYYICLPSYVPKTKLVKTSNRKHPLVILDVKNSRDSGACLTLIHSEIQNINLWKGCQGYYHALCKKGMHVI